MADEPTPQQSAIAVAITAGFFGVYVLDNLVTAALLAGLAAYLTTTDSQAGDVATSTGGRAPSASARRCCDSARRACGKRGLGGGRARSGKRARSHPLVPPRRDGSRTWARMPLRPERRAVVRHWLTRARALPGAAARAPRCASPCASRQARLLGVQDSGQLRAGEGRAAQGQDGHRQGRLGGAADRQQLRPLRQDRREAPREAHSRTAHRASRTRARSRRLARSAAAALADAPVACRAPPPCAHRSRRRSRRRPTSSPRSRRPSRPR